MLNLNLTLTQTTNVKLTKSCNNSTHNPIISLSLPQTENCRMILTLNYLLTEILLLEQLSPQHTCQITIKLLFMCIIMCRLFHNNVTGERQGCSGLWARGCIDTIPIWGRFPPPPSFFSRLRTFIPRYLPARTENLSPAAALCNSGPQ